VVDAGAVIFYGVYIPESWLSEKTA